MKHPSAGALAQGWEQQNAFLSPVWLWADVQLEAMRAAQDNNSRHARPFMLTCLLHIFQGRLIHSSSRAYVVIVSP
jgi:hypothetical protein